IRSLSSPVDRLRFRRAYLKHSGRFEVYRTKTAEMAEFLSLAYGILASHALRTGERLAKEKTIEEPDQILFLRWDEIPGALRGEYGSYDLVRLLHYRQALAKVWATRAAPAGVSGHACPSGREASLPAGSSSGA